MKTGDLVRRTNRSGFVPIYNYPLPTSTSIFKCIGYLNYSETAIFLGILKYFYAKILLKNGISGWVLDSDLEIIS